VRNRLGEAFEELAKEIAENGTCLKQTLQIKRLVKSASSSGMTETSKP